MLEALYRHDGWNIGLIRAGPASLLSGGTPRIEWLSLDGRHGFAADPFLIEEGGTLFCFFEALPYATNRGKICYVALDGQASGRLRVHDAIVESHHLSTRICCGTRARSCAFRRPRKPAASPLMLPGPFPMVGTRSAR